MGLAPPSQPRVAPSPSVVDEPSDKTQLADAIFRAQCGKTGSPHPVKLGQPTVSYTVPSNLGFLSVACVSQARFGLTNIAWLSDRLNETMRNYHISPTVLPIFQVHSTFLYIHSPNNCWVLGYQGATAPKDCIQE